MNPLANTDVAVRRDALPACAETVVALTELRAGSCGSDLRTLLLRDPGAMLAFLSLPQRIQIVDFILPTADALEPEWIADLLDALRRSSLEGFADWSTGPAREAYLVSQTISQAARRLSPETHAEKAAIAGLFVPLGRMALACDASTLSESTDFALRTRELARRWAMPQWLSSLLLCLDLSDELAVEFGIERELVLAVQSATAIVQSRRPCDGLPKVPAAVSLDPTVSAEMERILMAEIAVPVGSNAGSPDLIWRMADLAHRGNEPAGGNRIVKLEREAEKLRKHLDRLRSEVASKVEEKKLLALVEFAAGAGHEINNPLAVISVQAQQMLKDEENLSRAKALDRIIAQSRRIHAVLRDLMVFARPPTPQLKSANLGKVVKEAVEGQTGFALERGVTIETQGLGGKHQVRIDEGLIETAVGCLVRNAIEAAPAEGWVRVAILGDAADAIQVVVEGNGPSLSPEQRDHMFEPFYSGRSAGRGTGLGLPKAWRIAQIHGGSVRCECEAGQTTHFVLILPRPVRAQPTSNSNGHNGHRGHHGRNGHLANGHRLGRSRVKSK